MSRSRFLTLIAVLLPAAIAAMVLAISAVAVFQKNDLAVAVLRNYLICALSLCLLAGVAGAFLVQRLVVSPVDTLKKRILSAEQSAGIDELSNIADAFEETSKALNLAKQRERTLVDYALDVVCSLSPEGNFLAVSPAVLRCWGHLPETMVGKSIGKFVYKDDVDATLEALKQVNEKSEFENRIVKPDGNIVDASWVVTRSKSDGVLFCVVADITERKKLERTKQQFMAMITHELKSPLSSFLFVMQLLLKGHYGQLTEEGKRYIAATEQDVERLINLISELLDLEKIDAREFAVSLSPLALKPVIEAARHSVSGLAEKKGVKIEDRSQEFTVNGDAARLVQVVANLLSNAIRFSPAGSVICIETANKISLVEVRIQDSGTGISKQDQKVIFERFRSFSNSTGLGLAICKGLIEAHGGRIGVESDLGQGATFWFTLHLA